MQHKEVNSLHFIGICGTAMASVAALCRERGFVVTGSDENVYPPMSTFLESRGIRIIAGYRETNLDHTPDLIVVGNAMRRGNPEVERALDERRRITSLPELVSDILLPGKQSIVVAGTHGKTTTTSMLAWVLESAALNPGFLIGGIPHNFGCGARLGAGPHFVIEGDEYDTAFFDKRSKFVHYRPDIAILNNIEFDHADIFANLDAVKRSFRQLVAIVPRRGLIIANAADANVLDVTAGALCEMRLFTAADADGYDLPLPGDHNKSNAAAVIACATALGLTRDQIQRGLSTFAGVKRRMEVRGEAGGVIVLDDFAHHPTAISETIRAIRQRYPQRRLWVLFEPRSNTTRRNIFQRELADALSLADGVFIGKVDRLHELGERDRLDPEMLARDIQQAGKPAAYTANTEDLLAQLVPQLAPGDIVAVFTNGKFDNIHEKLLDRLSKRSFDTPAATG
jgi:UDP-N-acetylmuramate: L-alanyl-gamma-D-glutamyl-meso-diaminopimelate ligase